MPAQYAHSMTPLNASSNVWFLILGHLPPDENLDAVFKYEDVLVVIHSEVDAYLFSWSKEVQTIRNDLVSLIMM